MFPIPFNIKCLFFIKAFKDIYIYNSDLLHRIILQLVYSVI